MTLVALAGPYTAKAYISILFFGLFVGISFVISVYMWGFFEEC